MVSDSAGLDFQLLNAVKQARVHGERSQEQHRRRLIAAVNAALDEGHTKANVARAAGVSRNTIYQWRKAGLPQ